jgi:hypothetical protein
MDRNFLYSTIALLFIALGLVYAQKKNPDFFTELTGSKKSIDSWRKDNPDWTRESPPKIEPVEPKTEPKVEPKTEPSTPPDQSQPKSEPRRKIGGGGCPGCPRG